MTRQLGLALRGTVPLLLSLAAVLLSVAFYRVPDLSLVTPSLAVMVVFYWSINRPDLMPAPAAFLVGLVQDVLSGSPTGMMALVMLLVHVVAVSQRQVFYGKPFPVAWWGFAMVASGAALVSWVVSSAWMGSLIQPLPVIYQALLTIALYPFIAGLLGQVHQRVFRGT